MKKKLFCFFVIASITIGCGDNKGPEEASNEDYIDITSVEPVIVTEGELVSFIINADVRLASETSGSIFIGFNNNLASPGKYIVKEVAILSVSYEGSLSFDLADFDFFTYPIFLEQPQSYNVYINLSPPVQNSSATWTPISSDTWPIAVNEGTSQINDELRGFYAECDFLECNGRYNSEWD